MPPVTTITIRGTLAGEIWEPGHVSTKSFSVSSKDFHRSFLTLREMAFRALAELGDWRWVQILNGTVEFEREHLVLGRSARQVIRRRIMDIRSFPSVSDLCIHEEEYSDVMDALNDEALDVALGSVE